MSNCQFYFIIVLWINFIIMALLKRASATYTELLIGAIISASGHITSALCVCDRSSAQRYGFVHHANIQFRYATTPSPSPKIRQAHHRSLCCRISHPSGAAKCVWQCQTDQLPLDKMPGTLSQKLGGICRLVSDARAKKLDANHLHGSEFYAGANHQALCQTLEN